MTPFTIKCTISKSCCKYFVSIRVDFYGTPASNNKASVFDSKLAFLRKLLY